MKKKKKKKTSERGTCLARRKERTKSERENRDERTRE